MATHRPWPEQFPWKHHCLPPSVSVDHGIFLHQSMRLLGAVVLREVWHRFPGHATAVDRGEACFAWHNLTGVALHRPAAVAAISSQYHPSESCDLQYSPTQHKSS